MRKSDTQPCRSLHVLTAINTDVESAIFGREPEYLVDLLKIDQFLLVRRDGKMVVTAIKQQSDKLIGSTGDCMTVDLLDGLILDHDVCFFLSQLTYVGHGDYVAGRKGHRAFLRAGISKMLYAIFDVVTEGLVCGVRLELANDSEAKEVKH